MHVLFLTSEVIFAQLIAVARQRASLGLRLVTLTAANDDIRREAAFVVLSDTGWDQVFGLSDHVGPLLVDGRLNAVLALLIGVADFGDDEVEEDERREEDHQDPHDPEKDMHPVQLLHVDE